MLMSLTFVAGMLAGWYTSKPVWLDAVIQKIKEKVTGFIKK